MAPRHKGKSKAIEVPPHISFSQVEALCEAFPGEEQAIQEVLMADVPSSSSPSTPCPPSTTGQKWSQSDAGLTPDAKRTLPLPTPSQEHVALPPPPPSPPSAGMVEDTPAPPPALPEIFSDMSVLEFKEWILDLIHMCKSMEKVSQSGEALNFTIPDTTERLGPFVAGLTAGVVNKFKPILSKPLTDVVTSPEVNRSVPPTEPPKAEPAPPLKKEMKGAPGKPVAAPHLPFPLPSSQRALAPKDAPPVSVSKHMRRKQGKHTTHSPSRCGIHLTPPAGSQITAASFTPAVIDGLNKHIGSDLHGDLCLTSAHVAPQGIFLQSTHTPTSQEISFMLRHVQKIFPSQDGKHIVENQATSTSYLKVLDVHAIGNDCKMWSQETAKLFKEGLKLSPAGQELAKRIKNAPRIMRNSCCSDTCMVWVDIHDTVTGSFARGLIGQFIPIAGMNCCIASAKPHAGLLQCTQCLKWGHHYS
jgi:hypothetical protein